MNLRYSTVVGLVREGENSQVKKNSKSDDDTKPSHDYSTLTDLFREGETSNNNSKENTKPSHNHSTDTDYYGEGVKRLPYLVFDFYVSLNKFSPSQYFSKDISDRKELHDLIWELHSQGWGYTKIHQYLIQNDFEIGKSRTSVYHILKKLKKRKQVLSQNEVGEYRNFELVWLEE